MLSKMLEPLLDRPTMKIGFLLRTAAGDASIPTAKVAQ